MIYLTYKKHINFVVGHIDWRGDREWDKRLSNANKEVDLKGETFFSKHANTGQQTTG